jgi:hypothetical protein
MLLFIAGDQVPVIPFKEVVGSGLNKAPAQMGARCVNVGVMVGITFTVTVSVAVHPIPLLAVSV